MDWGKTHFSDTPREVQILLCAMNVHASHDVLALWSKFKCYLAVFSAYGQERMST